MRTLCILIAPLLFYGAAALAGPIPDPLKSPPVAPGLQDGSGRFELAATLSLAPAAAKHSGDGRFALLADLDKVSAPLPHTERYTLKSQLGDPSQLAVCGGGLPDPLFGNGFEN